MAIGSPQAPSADSSRLFTAAEIVHRNVLWTLGACFVPVPAVDLIAIMAVQVKMMSELSVLYGAPFREALARKLVVSLLASAGGLAAGMVIALSLGKAIPGVGHLVGFASLQLFSGAFTHATGRVYIMHLETGGTLLDFDPRAVRDHFRREFAAGKQVASDLQGTAPAAFTSQAAAAPIVRAPTVTAPASPAATSAAPASPAVIIAATNQASTVTAPAHSDAAAVGASPTTSVVITAAAPVLPATTPEPLASPASPVLAALIGEPTAVAAAVASDPPAPENLPPFTTAPTSLSSPVAAIGEALVSALPDPAASPASVAITRVHYKGTVKGTQSDEYAEISNFSDVEIDMSGWTLDADGTRQTYTFPPGTQIAPGQVIRVYTDEVHPATGGFKFGIRRAIWNDLGDRARLRDASGAIVSAFAYGNKQ